MKNSPEMLGNGSTSQDRFAGAIPYRGTQRRDGLGLPEQPSDGNRGNATPPLEDISTMPTLLEPPQAPSMSMKDLDALAEPVFPPAGWLDDSQTATGTLADHPLLRGLLLELPPKGTVPPPGWLDRWFEATRSILELLYVQSATAAPRR